MIKADIDGIFQTPIYRTKITQDFSKKQLSGHQRTLPKHRPLSKKEQHV